MRISDDAFRHHGNRLHRVGAVFGAAQFADDMHVNRKHAQNDERQNRDGDENFYQRKSALLGFHRHFERKPVKTLVKI